LGLFGGRGLTYHAYIIATLLEMTKDAVGGVA